MRNVFSPAYIFFFYLTTKPVCSFSSFVSFASFFFSVLFIIVSSFCIWYSFINKYFLKIDLLPSQMNHVFKIVFYILNKLSDIYMLLYSVPFGQKHQSHFLSDSIQMHFWKLRSVWVPARYYGWHKLGVVRWRNWRSHRWPHNFNKFRYVLS